MQETILTNFREWASVNEAAVPLTQGSVGLFSAYSSESNVRQTLAKRMGGADNTKQYMFTLNKITDVSNLANILATAQAVPIADSTHNDILTLGASTVSEKGSITLLKSEVAGPIQITAANNGLLTLFRLSDCFKDFSAKKVNGATSIAGLSNWAVLLTLGNPVNSEGRGFSYWVAAPGENSSTANGIALSSILLAIRAAGMPEEFIDLKDNLISSYYTAYVKPYVDKKDYQGALNGIAKVMAANLKKRNFIVAENPIVSMAGFNSTVASLKPTFSYPREKGWVMRFQPNQYKATSTMLADIASAIASGGSTAEVAGKAAQIASSMGFDQKASSVVTEYTNAMRTDLANGDIPFFVNLIQQTPKAGGASAPASIGTQAKGVGVQGEGQFGKPTS